MSDQFQTQFPGGGFPPAGSGFPGAAGGFPQAGMGAPQPGPGFGPGPGVPGAPAPRPQAPTAQVPPAKAESRPKGRDRRGKGAAGDKPDKPVTRRAVSRQVVIAGVFAVAVAVVGVGLYGGGEDTVYVVRSQSDISAGTEVSGGLLEAAALPKGAIEPGTITAETADAALKKATDELSGVVTQYPIAAKAQIRPSQFGLQATLGEQLAPNERLVSIKATVGTAVAGGLVPGDRVDIIGAADGWTRVVAANVPIMSITVSEDLYNSVADAQSADKNVRPDEALPGDPVPGIYVVKVPADLVPALLNWNQSATLHLSYRGADAVDVPVDDNFLGDQDVAAPQP